MATLTRPKMKSIVFLYLCLVSTSVHSFEPEFIRSFLSRPWMLTNNSMIDPALKKNWNQEILSIYLDNWSPHYLKLTGDEIRSGTFSTGLLPKDQNLFSRSLALRSLSSKETHTTSGM